MGANAQTSVPSFADGQVLTGQQQTEINTGIPVFATSVERDAAFGGTGEKVLAEGQFAFLEDSNTTQFYDGASWQPVGVAPGIVCVKAETALSSTSVTADNVFTSDYSNYLILLRYTTVGNNQISGRLRVGGVSASGSDYNQQSIAGVASSALAGISTNQTSFQFTVQTNGDFKSSAAIHLFSPAIAEATNLQIANNPSLAGYTTLRNYVFTANHTLATAYDGIEFFCVGNMAGTYAIYGYSKTV
jgi:hypothetical protein